MIKVALVQYNNCFKVSENIKKLEFLLRDVTNFDIIAFPENVFCMPISYEQLYNDSHEFKNNPEITWAQNLAKSKKADVIIGSIAIKEKGKKKLKNRSVYIDKSGIILGFYDKMNLFDANLAKGEVYRESKNFDAGKKSKIIDSRHGKIGLSICFDVRFPEMFRKMAFKGAKILSIPAAFTYTTGKLHWEILLRARAIENSAFVLAPALCGLHNNKRRTYGHSMIIAPSGEIIAQASEDKDEIIYGEIDLKLADLQRKNIPNLK